MGTPAYIGYTKDGKTSAQICVGYHDGIHFLKDAIKRLRVNSITSDEELKKVAERIWKRFDPDEYEELKSRETLGDTPALKIYRINGLESADYGEAAIFNASGRTIDGDYPIPAGTFFTYGEYEFEDPETFELDFKTGFRALESVDRKVKKATCARASVKAVTDAILEGKDIRKTLADAVKESANLSEVTTDIVKMALEDLAESYALTNDDPEMDEISFDFKVTPLGANPLKVKIKSIPSTPGYDFGVDAEGLQSSLRDLGYNVTVTELGEAVFQIA